MYNRMILQMLRERKNESTCDCIVSWLLREKTGNRDPENLGGESHEVSLDTVPYN